MDDEPDGEVEGGEEVEGNDGQGEGQHEQEVGQEEQEPHHAEHGEGHDQQARAPRAHRHARALAHVPQALPEHHLELLLHRRGEDAVDDGVGDKNDVDEDEEAVQWG